MNASKTSPSRSSLTTVHVLAALLERLENSKVPVGAEQYRSVVLHLVDEFNDVSDQGLGALLDAHPAAAQVYENVNYAYAGLCRSPLESSLSAEALARTAIERAMRPPTEGITNGQR